MRHSADTYWGQRQLSDLYSKKAHNRMVATKLFAAIAALSGSLTTAYTAYELAINPTLMTNFDSPEVRGAILGGGVSLFFLGVSLFTLAAKLDADKKSVPPSVRW